MAKTKSKLRAIPGVDTLLEAVSDCPLPHPLIVATIRRELKTLRKNKDIPEVTEITSLIKQRLKNLELSRLQPVINGTGIMIHTNLGRSPLPKIAEAGYINLEIDLASGRRGKRAAYLEQCLAELCGAEAAMVTNNCAAAVVLILRHLTAEKKGVVISRGELVQIGGDYRIPDILESTGAKLKEIGTTNRTNLEDYNKAIGKETALVLKVHRSNFFMEGFIGSPARRELATLARKKRVPFVEDLGSGVFLPTESWANGHHEPTPKEVLKDGADLVCFSGDKMLGGPQAGIIAGKFRHVQALKKHPFFRALRCDKLILNTLQRAVEAYLHDNADELPLHRCLNANLKQLRRRAAHLVKKLKKLPLSPSITEAQSQVGGGSLPQASLPSIALDLFPEKTSLKDFAAHLRRTSTPVIGVITGQKFRIDMRTILPEQDKLLLKSIIETIK